MLYTIVIVGSGFREDIEPEWSDRQWESVACEVDHSLIVLRATPQTRTDAYLVIVLHT